MSLECVQFLNTVISRESILIKLFEASNEDRDVINVRGEDQEIRRRCGACIKDARIGRALVKASGEEDALKV